MYLNTFKVFGPRSDKPYIKSHLELQREITLKELALAITFLSKVFVLHI